MKNQDRYPSYLIKAFNDIHHYVNYRGRTYEDLAMLQKAVHELNQAIDIRLVRDFKDHPEMVELFEWLENKKVKD